MGEREPSPHDPELSDSTRKWIETFIKALDNPKSPEYQEIIRVQEEFRDKGYDREVYAKILDKILQPIEELRNTGKDEYIGSMKVLCAVNFIAGYKEGQSKAENEKKLNSLL